MNNRGLGFLFSAVLPIVVTSITVAGAQQSLRRFQCTGDVSGVPSEASIEITAGGIYTEGPDVAGSIRNQFAAYGFNGRLFGGVEGFVSLVELRTGERIDRVWIGVSHIGFALRTEDGAMYTFQCRE
jgi:hypothetical protein